MEEKLLEKEDEIQVVSVKNLRKARSENETETKPLNLLNIKPLRMIAESKYFPIVPQFFMLFA
ncbi:MAG: hypothetical protein U9N45_06475, partial [Gemmatimonadota bacterium]|nr:hypothetical protein [Gemmatimonadota bacterium]